MERRGETLGLGLGVSFPIALHPVQDPDDSGWVLALPPNRTEASFRPDFGGIPSTPFAGCSGGPGTTPPATHRRRASTKKLSGYQQLPPRSNLALFLRNEAKSPREPTKPPGLNVAAENPDSTALFVETVENTMNIRTLDP